MKVDLNRESVLCQIKQVFWAGQMDWQQIFATRNDRMKASEIRELPDDKLLIISDNRKTTLIDVYPSHKSARWLRMMKLPPAPIASKAQDRLVFIPL